MVNPELVWFAAGLGDVRPARVTKGDPAKRGSLDLVVMNGVTATTYNPPLEDLETGSRSFGPPRILVDSTVSGKDEILKGVHYDSNGEVGTWHEA